MKAKAIIFVLLLVGMFVVVFAPATASATLPPDNPSPIDLAFVVVSPGDEYAPDVVPPPEDDSMAT